MSRTYKATGINLKGMPLGESDRLLSILTREFGLIRAVAPGSRKHKSKLGGRSGLFVVNELLITKGRSLDKITQAETLESYPGLSLDLGKLTASQYLAELVLYQALSNQPQEELFCLLNEHLSRLEDVPRTDQNLSLVVLAHLAHATFHLLALAGIAPQVQACCLTQRPLTPDFSDPDWRVGFSTAVGGTISLGALERLEVEGLPQPKWFDSPSRPSKVVPISSRETTHFPNLNQPMEAQSKSAEFSGVIERSPSFTPTPVSSVGESKPLPYPAAPRKRPRLDVQLNAAELAILQQLAQPQLLPLNLGLHQPEALAIYPFSSSTAWLSVERLLRQYVQYHFDRPIRSAALIDTCFVFSANCSLTPLSHDATV
jgi:DNA repair protein RecO (recombination protein O)